MSQTSLCSHCWLRGRFFKKKKLNKTKSSEFSEFNRSQRASNADMSPHRWSAPLLVTVKFLVCTCAHAAVDHFQSRTGPPPRPRPLVSYYAGSSQTPAIAHRTPCPRGTLLPVTPAGDVRSPAATRGDAETGRALQGSVGGEQMQSK